MQLSMYRDVKSHGFRYKIIDAGTANIYGTPNITRLTAALSERKCELLSLKEQDESLESFYISLVGGGKNE